MTYIDQLKRDIISAGEFLKNNPDWEPDEFTRRCMESFDNPLKALGHLVIMLTED